VLNAIVRWLNCLPRRSAPPQRQQLIGSSKSGQLGSHTAIYRTFTR